MTMRPDPYTSSWRKVGLGLVIVVLVVIIAIGITITGRQSDSRPSGPASDPASSPTATADPTDATTAPEMVDPVNAPENDPELDKAVLAFVEAYNLPSSDTRNTLLRNLSTDDGYAMVYRDTETMSLAEKSAGNIEIWALPGDTSIQVEPFGDDMTVVSVYTVPTVRTERDGVVLHTLQLPGFTSSWVSESGVWKLAHIQF